MGGGEGGYIKGCSRPVSLLTWISEGTHGSTITMEDSDYDLEHMEVDGQNMDIDTGSRLELMEYSHGKCFICVYG